MRDKIITWSAFASLLVAFLLSYVANATPIKIQPIAATASQTYSGTSPKYVFDGNASTTWNAGTAPGVQPYPWIQIDLGRTVAIQKIRLLPAQSPNGYTIHQITAGQNPLNLETVGGIATNTYDNNWIEFVCKTNMACGNVRYIRISTSQSPSWVAWREIEVYQNVEYMGYWWDAVDSDHIAETTAVGANVVLVGGAMDEWSAKVAEATQHNAKVVLFIENYLFDANFRLYTNWKEYWSSILAFINTLPQGTIAALYPIDEPYNHWAQQSDLEEMAAQIHKDVTIPLAAIFATTEFYETNYSLAMFDWIGFDCYSPWATGCRDHSMDDVIQRFKTKLTANQRMIAVPWACREDGQSSLSAQNEVVSVLSQWQKQVTADPAYVLIMPYIWQTMPSLNTIGTADLPLVKERIYQMAHHVLQSEKVIYPVDYTASGTYDVYYPFFAFDRVANDMWNSGNYAPQWILADLGGTRRVNGVTLTFAQDITGTTSSIIEGLTQSGSWTLLGAVGGVTSDGQKLGWSGTADVSQIRVTTSTSPTWIAWREISISHN